MLIPHEFPTYRPFSESRPTLRSGERTDEPVRSAISAVAAKAPSAGVEFMSPTVANGRVHVPNYDKAVNVYGLLPR